MTSRQTPVHRARKLRRCAWVLLGLTAIGCGEQDAERLSRIGRLVADRAQVLTAGANKLADGWQAMRGDLDDAALDARVSSRLRWDKNLAGVTVEVHAEGSIITLRGAVADVAQRRRAIELAESTAGVEKVNDQMHVPGQDS